MTRAAIVDAPIDPARLLREVSRASNGAGILFVGTVRDVNDDRAVTGIEYKAYRPMAERELDTIVREAAEQYGTEDIVVEHRVGVLILEDISVAIAVGHPRRGKAYGASRYVIEELKHRVPVWKLELYADGTREWVSNITSVVLSEAKDLPFSASR
jgi:molybdopterin synthase catalytic subunit